MSFTSNANLQAMSVENYCISTHEIKEKIELSYSVKKTPVINPAIKLPDLKDKPCSFLASIWGSCEKAPVIYSSNLNRFFMTGHQVTLFGTSSPYGIEVVNGQIKPLPEQLYGAEYAINDNMDSFIEKNGEQRFFQFKGAIFRGYYFGDALFYDGSTVFSVLDNYLNKSVINLENHKWMLYISPISKRVFLRKSPRYYQNPFLVELKSNSGITLTKDGLTVMPIYEPDTIANSGYHLYEFPDDLQLMIVGRQIIAVEISNTLRTVVIVPEPYYISNKGQASARIIQFSIHNPETKVDTNYFIVRKSQSTKCLASLNPKKPVLLYNE
jgi:hypothetical protein